MSAVAGYDQALTVLAFKGASGIGAVGNRRHILGPDHSVMETSGI
jgi:hypothetical protein